MIRANVRFGRSGQQSKTKLENLAATYLARLLHQGQLCSEYFYAWTNGVLNAYVHMPAPDASDVRHHSSYGMETLAELRKSFGKDPEWKIVEDRNHKAASTWRRAPFLYLVTHAFDDGPPFCRGDDGKPVPSYLLSIPYEARENIYFWQHNYQSHDHVWLGCGKLEIPAYRELADPDSELSRDGRELCELIEQVTRIPTYYYLMRFWGRRSTEEKRKCPGCGKPWRTRHAAEKRNDFWLFTFQCPECRLVSHSGNSNDDERHAVIGEFKSVRNKAKK